MFPIHVFDGDATSLPEDPICYLVTKNGMFLKKSTGLISSITPVQQIGFLQSLTPSVAMNVKIPFDIIQKTYSFMKAIYEDLRSESMVIIVMDQQTKKYDLLVPRQSVTAGSIKYVIDDSFYNGKLKIGTIHSHASMSAFHSSVDVADEKDWDGIHITLGNLNLDNKCSIACSLAANGIRCTVEPMDYIDGIQLEKLPELKVDEKPLSAANPVDMSNDNVPIIDRVFSLFGTGPNADPFFSNGTKNVPTYVPKPYFVINYKKSFPVKWLALVAKPEYKPPQYGGVHTVPNFMGVRPNQNLLPFDNDLRSMFRDREEDKCSTCIYKQLYEDEVREGVEDGTIEVADSQEPDENNLGEYIAGMIERGEL